MSKYIIANQDRLFDHRNVRVALVEGDPLGHALGGLRAFHRSQLENLVKKQTTTELRDKITITVKSGNTTEQYHILPTRTSDTDNQTGDNAPPPSNVEESQEMPTAQWVLTMLIWIGLHIAVIAVIYQYIINGHGIRDNSEPQNK